MKPLVFEIDLDPIVSKLTKKMRKFPVARSAFEDYGIAIANKVTSLVAQGASNTEINMELNVISRKHYSKVKKFYQDKIGGKIPFDSFKDLDSNGITIEKRIETSVKRSMLATKKKSIALSSKIKTKLASSSIEKEKFITNFVQDFANSISESLGVDSNRLVKTETRRITQKLDDDKHKGEKCEWVLGTNENHCQECLGYEGNIYDSPQNAPERPVHPNCECYLKYL